MKIENPFLQEISWLIKMFDKAFLLLYNDKFHFEESQIEKFIKIKEISDLLDEKNFDTTFMQLANEGFKEIIFSDLISKISKYDDLVFEKKVITNNFYLNSYFENIPALLKIQQRIKIKENDILEVQNTQSGMPESEKQKIINEFKIELFTLQKEKKMIFDKCSWIKTNYYYKINSNAGEIITRIENYFNVSVLKPTNEIFDSDLTLKIFNKMVEEKYIYSKSQLSYENFHLILNFKNPKFNSCNSIKVTHFGYLFQLLSDNVGKKGFNKIEWEDFVIKEFDFKRNTLESRFFETEKNKIFYDIINLETVKNGK